MCPPGLPGLERTWVTVQRLMSFPVCPELRVDLDIKAVFLPVMIGSVC